MPQRSERAPVPHVVLRSGEIEVWSLDLRSVPARRAAALERLLDPAERRRIAGLLGAERFAALAAHALARVHLSALLGTPPERLAFVRSPHGKPALDPADNPRAVRFSLAHSRRFVAVASRARREIGIDVETSARRFDAVALARRFFAPGEAETIARLDAPSARDRFVTLWSIKEAVLKASGFGLRLPPSALEVELDPPRVVRAHAALGPPGGWNVTLFRPASHDVVAVAFQDGHEPPPGEREIRC